MRTVLKSLVAVLLYTLCMPVAHAQEPHVPSQQTNKASATEGAGYGGGDVYGYVNVFAGPAFPIGDSSVKFAGTAGVTLGTFQAKPLGKSFGTSPALELGVIGPVPGGRDVDGLFSANGVFSTIVPHHEAFPFFTGGYTRVFATGNAINLGVGIDFGRRKSDRIIRIEVRDYYLFTRTQQHILGLRIAFGNIFSDN
jgi:hypothetical protein